MRSRTHMHRHIHDTYTWADDSGFPNTGPYGSFTWSGVVVAEMVYTCLLCYVVLAVATVKDMSHSKDIFGLAIAFSIVAGGVYI